jgi:hypothetical protein
MAMPRNRSLAIVLTVSAAVTLPIIAIGQPIISHGGPPSDVYTNVLSADVCNGGDPVRRTPVRMLPTPVNLAAESHVVAYFTSTLSRKRFPGNEASLLIRLSKPGLVGQSPPWIERVDPGHSTVTVMWTFENMPSGNYTIRAIASVPGLGQDEPGVNLQSCAFTVLVTPVVP